MSKFGFKITQFHILVFFTAFFTLMFELIISKVANFHLDFRNSYLALPITFLGLSIGSLHVHFSTKLRENFDIRRNLYLLGGVVFVTFFIIFIIFTEFFAIAGVGGYDLHIPMLVAKSFFFVAVFILPFYVFGRILTLCFNMQKEDIGHIYGLDFLGAALACLVTPILFHFVNLPAVIITLLATISMLVILMSRVNLLTRILMTVVLGFLNLGFYVAIDKMEGNIEYLYWTTMDDPPETVEIANRWNEFSRVQLVEFRWKDASRNYYKIIHDNARSNVHVRPYVPGVTKQPKVLDALEAPYIMGHDPKEILVIFAGCGAEMLEFNEYSAGKANITGIEINRACADLVVEAEELSSYRLAEFYELPNIDLRFEEGRSFIELTEKKYDTIFVGSSAPTALAFTGHTRKYLYTKESLSRYLDILSEDGVLLFNHQPTRDTLEMFKLIFLEQGRDDFENCVILLQSSEGAMRGSPDLLVKPSGFSPEEVQKLATFSANAPQMIQYAPHFNRISPNAKKDIIDPVDFTRVATDDKPFIYEMNFTGYTLIPSAEDMKNAAYYMSWMRVTAMIALCAVTLFFIIISQFTRKERRIPFAILTYLLITGFIYLLVEVAFIAKLELFLQNALVSMASVITIFLLTSGLGSWSYKKVAGRLGMIVFPVLAGVTVLLCTLALNYLVPKMMDLPLMGRLLVTALTVSPVGWLLGMFYPYSVDCLVRHNKGEAVPITYGISTLSSVIGASYAMVFMIVLGFNELLWQGVVLYFVLAALILVYSVSVKENIFSK